MAKMCVIMSVLLFGVTMDAYQALRFAEYLKKWGTYDRGICDHVLAYYCSYNSTDWWLTLLSQSMVLCSSDPHQFERIEIKDCLDPTKWVSENLVKLSNLDKNVNQ
jgi:hypothetical protein